MKIKYISGVLLLLFMIACVFGIVVMSNSEKWQDIEIDSSQNINNITQIRSEVMKGKVTSKLSMTGSVEGGVYGECQKVISINYKNQKERQSYKCFHHIGDEVEAGEKMYAFNGKIVNAKSDCRIISIVEEDDYAEIDYLDFSVTYIAVLVDIAKVDDLNIGKKVQIVIDAGNGNQEKYKEHIIGIDSVVEENQIKVYISNKHKLLIGESVKVKCSITKKKESMYILKNMLLQDGDRYYVNLMQNNDIVQRFVEIGDFFCVENEGVITDFVEIIDGLSEGNRIMIEEVVDEQRATN